MRSIPAPLARVLCGAALLALAPHPAAALVSKPSSTSFHLFPNKAFKSCFTNAGSTAKVDVTVTRGARRDSMVVTMSGFKPGLDFDLFTVQNSPQKADGTANPSFTNFGLAWYQSDIHVKDDGTATAAIKTNPTNMRSALKRSVSPTKNPTTLRPTAVYPIIPVSSARWVVISGSLRGRTNTTVPLVALLAFVLKTQTQQHNESAGRKRSCHDCKMGCHVASGTSGPARSRTKDSMNFRSGVLLATRIAQRRLSK